MATGNGVTMLELNIQGFKLNPSLIWDEETAILVDTGMPGQLETIKSVMNEAGVPFDRLKAVILTHQDLDHVGSLPEILDHSKHDIKVYAHPLDKPYIEGDYPLIKTDPNRMSEAEWSSLPEPMKYLYKNPPVSKVDLLLEDQQVLPYGGGIKVIFTPGHTPGHISLYLEESKTLIAGDSLVVVKGVLHGPIPQTTLDMKTAIDSIEKYIDLDIETIFCYHGGIYNVKEKNTIAELVDRLKSANAI